MAQLATMPGRQLKPLTASSVSSRWLSRWSIASATVIGSPTHVVAGRIAADGGALGDVTTVAVGEGFDGGAVGAAGAQATTQIASTARNDALVRITPSMTLRRSVTLRR